MSRIGWPGSALSLFWLLFCLFAVLSASALPLILSLLETRLRHHPRLTLFGRCSRYSGGGVGVISTLQNSSLS